MLNTNVKYKIRNFKEKLDLIKGFTSKMIILTENYNAKTISDNTYVDEMIELERKFTPFYLEFGLAKLVPIEYGYLNNHFHAVFAMAHNIVLPFSELGLSAWKNASRDYLVKSAIKDYQRDLRKLETVLSKLEEKEELANISDGAVY